MLSAVQRITCNKFMEYFSVRPILLIYHSVKNFQIVYLKALFINLSICHFLMSQQKKTLWKVHLDKTTLKRGNWENRMLKVGLTEYSYIYFIYNTDWLSTIFLNYFESELFQRDTPSIKNVSFVETQKNIIYSNLVNNPLTATHTIIHKFL